jgi:isopentenyl phosphate kinase
MLTMLTMLTVLTMLTADVHSKSFRSLRPPKISTRYAATDRAGGESRAVIADGITGIADCLAHGMVPVLHGDAVSASFARCA